MKINIFFLIILLIGSIAFIGDIIIYSLGINYEISIIIATVISILFIYVSKRNNKINISYDFEKTDIFLFIFMLSISITSGIVYPDYTYDTISYHSYLQKNPFRDKVNFDFFPGRIYCMFLFPLGDRMYYILRFLFGYRFGAILSFFSAIVIFYQIKNILKILTNNSARCSIFSYAVFLVTSYSIFLGTYYIDCLCILFTLQILLIILENKDILQDKYKLLLIGLISGISIGIKITQIFFIIPLYCYLIYRNKNDIKNLKITNLLFFALLNIIPYIVYLIDNYNQTGSILFPYYNSILKSEYFGIFNWVDERFVISGILEKILWPLQKLSYNKYGDDLIYEDMFFAIYYIGMIISLGYCLLNRKRNQIFELTILSIVLDIIWLEFLKGYFRYGAFVGIVFCIITLTNIINLLDFLTDGKNIITNFNKKRIFNLITVICLFINIIYLCLCCDFKNGTKIFKDKESSEYKISIDGVWGASYDCLGFVDLIREENTPIYNLHREYFETSKKTLEIWEDKIKNNDIYTIIDWYGEDLDNNLRIKNLKEDGFEIENIITYYNADEIPYINTNGEWILVKLKYIR